MSIRTPVAVHLERALGRAFTVELARRLEEAGLDVEAPLPRRVPLSEISRWLDVVRAQVFAGLPREEGLRRLGQRALDGVGHTLAEKAAFALLRILGPERALRHAESSLARSPLGLKLLQLDKHGATLNVRDAQGMPEFILGLLEAFGPKVGARGLTVALAPPEGKGATFHARWK